MAVRNLYRQARPFRVLGWSLFAIVLLALPVHEIDGAQRAGGLLLAALGACALDLLRCWSTEGGALPADAMVQRLQRAEMLLVPGTLLVLQLPLPIIIAVLGALATANVALGGARALPRLFFAFAASVSLVAMVTAFYGAGLPAIATSWHQLPGVAGASDWLPGVMMLLVFTLALCNVGFLLTQKLDDHRRLWQDRLIALQPFVPHGLARRMPMAQSRCWVTVVVTDLVDFTARSTPLPPELVSMVLDDLLDAVVAQAGRQGGTLDKFMGDGALLFFMPEPNRSIGAQKAWRFSRDLLAEMPALNHRWSGFGLDEKLQLRIGLASGYCSLGECGTSDVRAYTIIGACVGLAERLQTASDADSMALCALTTRLLGMADSGAVEPSVSRSPEQVEIRLDDDEIVEFSANYEELKGFARMRVFRPSAKVRTPLV